MLEPYLRQKLAPTPDLETDLIRVTNPDPSDAKPGWMPDALLGLMVAPEYVRTSSDRIIQRIRKAISITDVDLQAGDVNYHLQIEDLRVHYYCSAPKTGGDMHHESLILSSKEQEIKLRRGSRPIPLLHRVLWNYKVELQVEQKRLSGATVKRSDKIKNAQISRKQCEALEEIVERVCRAIREGEEEVGP